MIKNNSATNFKLLMAWLVLTLIIALPLMACSGTTYDIKKTVLRQDQMDQATNISDADFKSDGTNVYTNLKSENIYKITFSDYMRFSIDPIIKPTNYTIYYHNGEEICSANIQSEDEIYEMNRSDLNSEIPVVDIRDGFATYSFPEEDYFFIKVNEGTIKVKKRDIIPEADASN